MINEILYNVKCTGILVRVTEDDKTFVGLTTDKYSSDRSDIVVMSDLSNDIESLLKFHKLRRCKIYRDRHKLDIVSRSEMIALLDTPGINKQALNNHINNFKNIKNKLITTGYKLYPLKKTKIFLEFTR